VKISLFRPRIILMIGDDGIVVVPYDITGTSPFFVATDNKSAAQEITEFIARYPQARLTLFTDNLTQDYRSDDLPRLNFLDRAKLINRRLKQTFPAARLTASVRFKKTPNRVLMIGLHESNSVFTWADRLHARLPDIALLPVEGTRIAKRLMPESANGWAMLVSRQKSGGFRQIVTFKNDLVFTRLTPLPPADVIEDTAETVARDIKASLDYLTRHGLRDPQELSVLLLIPDDIHSAVAFESLSLKSIRLLSPAKAARQLSLTFAPDADDDAADILFAAHLLTRQRSTLSLMLPDARQVWLTQNVRQWGMRAACAALMVVAAATIWRAGDFAATLYRAQKENAQLDQTRDLLKQAQDNAAPVTEPLGRMRQALERRHIYERQTPAPWQGLNELASGLDQNSKIVKLAWAKDNDVAPEIFTVSLRIASEANSNDRAETVAAFARVTQNIAHSMPDYQVESTKPPYPALPQESVTVATNVTEDPVGEITIKRKEP
jgi:hypothetical protein